MSIERVIFMERKEGQGVQLGEKSKELYDACVIGWQVASAFQ